MFGQFFFLTQYLQGVRGYGPLEAGVAFLPLTLVMFSMVFVVPRLSARLGDARLLALGVAVAFAGVAWLSRIGVDTPYLTGIALPMIVLGLGAGAAFTPLTASGVAGVAPEDAGAASGVVNVAHQLGGSLGLGVLVTVFASALPTAAHSAGLAHAISTSVTAAAVMLALALVVVLALAGLAPGGDRCPLRGSARPRRVLSAAPALAPPARPSTARRFAFCAFFLTASRPTAGIVDPAIRGAGNVRSSAGRASCS
jgi:hypothetical protein